MRLQITFFSAVREEYRSTKKTDKKFKSVRVAGAPQPLDAPLVSREARTLRRGDSYCDGRGRPAEAPRELAGHGFRVKRVRLGPVTCLPLTLLPLPHIKPPTCCSTADFRFLPTCSANTANTEGLFLVGGCKQRAKYVFFFSVGLFLYEMMQSFGSHEDGKKNVEVRTARHVLLEFNKQIETCRADEPK